MSRNFPPGTVQKNASFSFGAVIHCIAATGFRDVGSKVLAVSLASDWASVECKTMGRSHSCQGAETAISNFV